MEPLRGHSYQLAMVTRHSFILAVAAASLFVNGCVTRAQLSDGHKGHHPINVPDAECEIEFFAGGEKSKEFKHALTHEYRPLRVSLVPGTNHVSKLSPWGAAEDHFVAGMESAEGKTVLHVLDSERPWEWHIIDGPRFSDNLYLAGSIGDHSWKYVTFYPDGRFEALLAHLRKVLGGK
jgi:hypothetical protein